jgi:DNA polymerase elongation subunit (family B)
MDSIYCSAETLMSSNDMTFDEKKQFTITLAREMESKLNTFYDTFAQRAFNCNKHRLHIKGESVASTGFWVAKKRYALDKVYDLETNQDVSKMGVKGLDVVRSSFPKAFREFMSGILKDILKRVPQSILDEKILVFKESLKDRDILDIARNTSANNINQYTDHTVSGIKAFKKGAPVHVKAAIVYNRLLEQYNLQDRYEPIADGEKIKYVLLKENSFRIDALALKGYNDPPEIMQLIEQYIDTDALFDNEMRNKLNDFYAALGWGNIPTQINQNAEEWFAF